MGLIFQRGVTFVTWLILLSLARAQDEPRSLPELPPLSAGALAYSKEHEIPVSGWVPTVDRGPLAGDHCSLLVTLLEGKKQTQWLIELTVVELTKEENPGTVHSEYKLYTSTGSELVFRNSIVGFEVRTHGPFGTKAAPQTKTARVGVNGEDLALGFHDASRCMARIRNLRSEGNQSETFGLGFSTKRFSEETIAQTKPLADKIGLSAQEEKALAGTGPALSSFFSIAQSTQGLREILMKVVDVPSAWSLLKRGGRVDPRFNLNSEASGPIVSDKPEPTHYVLAVDLLLNDQPGLKAMLVVTSPKPPLLTMAGIETLYASHPSRSDRRVMIQVLSTAVAQTPPAAKPL